MSRFCKVLRNGSNKIGCRLMTCKYSTYPGDVNHQSIPRITVPHKVAKNFEKNLERKLGKKLAERKLKGKGTGPLLISCRRKAYNFYQGQRFNELDVASMTSCGWKNTKRIGDYFTLMPYGENPSLQDYEDEPISFNELGINTDLCLGLNELGLESPTEVQRLAIPSLLEGQNVACAAETGSGKTLAYLLPCIEWVLKKKQTHRRQDQTFVNSNSPTAIVITPNRELCNQVMNVAESLSTHADFTPFCVIGGDKLAGADKSMKKIPMDILVTSPGKLITLLKKRMIKDRNLQHIVIDEADTLLDDSFIEDTRDIFNLLKITTAEHLPGNPEDTLAGTQLVLISATMPQNINEALGETLSTHELEKIKTEALHRIMPHVAQKFIRINPDSKNEKLFQLLKNEMAKKQLSPTLVFVKNNRTCHYISKLLKDMGLDNLKLHGGLSIEERTGVLDKFMEGYSDVLIATDIASRGIDTTNVGHVINFDCPGYMSDYIHRVGRVGRVGMTQNARVTTFVSQKWEVDLVWKIEICARKMKPLSDVNANIKRELEALHGFREIQDPMGSVDL